MNAADIDARVDAVAPELIELSHALVADPELAFEEVRSAAAVAGLLERHGFSVARGVAGLPTAFDARFGEGSFTVAFLAEYDALPGIGHACGHNIIAAAAAGAGIGLASVAAEHGVTVRVIGTPAEENGGGKVVMLRERVFDDVDVALMVHAGERDIVAPQTLALAEALVTFRGEAAHASAAPHQGRNATDAATLTQVAVGLLRQRMLPDQRLSGIVVDGGEAANIVPERAALAYTIRGATLESVIELWQQLTDCAAGAALATGTSHEVTESGPAYAELDNHPLLAEAVAEQFARLGRRAVRDHQLGASTDMGNVTRALPGVHPMIRVGDGSSGPHTREFADECTGPEGDAAVVDGAKVLAGAAQRLAADPESRRRVQAARR